jgi:hypothetical protein
MHKYSEVGIKKMLGILIDNIFVVVDGQVIQQSVGIPIGTNCAPLLANLVFVFIRGGIHSKGST